MNLKLDNQPDHLADKMEASSCLTSAGILGVYCYARLFIQVLETELMVVWQDFTHWAATQLFLKGLDRGLDRWALLIGRACA